MSKHKPATPLPWSADDKQDITFYCNADYIVAAANAYPRLVETLLDTLKIADANGCANKPGAIKARTLLRELGEL